MTALAVLAAHAVVLGGWALQPAPPRPTDAGVLAAWTVPATANATPTQAPARARGTGAAHAPATPASAAPPAAATSNDPTMEPPEPPAPDAASPTEPPVAAEAVAALPEPTVTASAAPPSKDGPASAAPATAEVRPPTPWAIPPDVWPRSAELHYDVRAEMRGLGLGARATLQWQAEGPHYSATLTLGALWAQRSQRSAGDITPAGLRPAEYADQGKRTRTLRLTWASPHEPGQAQREDGRTLSPLPSGAQDRLSMFMQLGAWVTLLQPPPGARLVVPVVGLGEVQTWTFVAGEHEALELPVGTLRAVRVQRVVDGGRALGVTLWYAPAWGVLPVRVLLQETDGQRIDQSLQSGRLQTASP